LGGKHWRWHSRWRKIHRDESSSGVKIDSLVPRPMESAVALDGLKNINIELVDCGEYHSCAVTLSGVIVLIILGSLDMEMKQLSDGLKNLS
jgi:alpha-tubulin suppressor-like RCC1 family protein